MYLELFLADFAVFRFFGGISRDFAEIPEFRGSATARNIRSPDYLMIWCSKNNRENYLENAFEQKKKKPGLIFNHWSALIGLRMTGPWRVMNINSYNMSSLLTPSLTTAICHYFITTNNVFITADRRPSSMTDVSLSNLVKWQLQLLGLKKVIF